MLLRFKYHSLSENSYVSYSKPMLLHDSNNAGTKSNFRKKHLSQGQQLNSPAVDMVAGPLRMAPMLIVGKRTGNNRSEGLRERIVNVPWWILICSRFCQSFPLCNHEIWAVTGLAEQCSTTGPPSFWTADNGSNKIKVPSLQGNIPII